MNVMNATESFVAKLKTRVEGPEGALAGKKALVIGIANAQSIAYGCALAFHARGARLAMTYLNEKTRRFTEPLAELLEAEFSPATCSRRASWKRWVAATYGVPLPALDAVGAALSMRGSPVVSWVPFSPIPPHSSPELRPVRREHGHATAG